MFGEVDAHMMNIYSKILFSSQHHSEAIMFTSQVKCNICKPTAVVQWSFRLHLSHAGESRQLVEFLYYHCQPNRGSTGGSCES